MTKCTGCGKEVDPLELFPRDRCLDCHADAWETRRELASMTSEKLSRMWGA